MKATEQYFPVVLFSILYKVVHAFEPMMTIQMIATAQFHIELFIILQNIVLTF